jgi:hypothetical protein
MEVPPRQCHGAAEPGSTRIGVIGYLKQALTYTYRAVLLTRSILDGSGRQFLFFTVSSSESDISLLDLQ